MPKTRNAFALRDFDDERILQRPYFKKFREEYQIGDDADEGILGTLKAIEGNSLEILEAKLKTIKTAHTLLFKFRDLINRHETRLNRYNKRATENQRGAPMIEYITAVFDIIELGNKFAKFYLELEKKIQKKYREEFTARLKKARKQAGLTQKQLGDLVEVSPQGFSRYERGERDVPIHTIVRLARVLKLSGDQILGLK